MNLRRISFQIFLAASALALLSQATSAQKSSAPPRIVTRNCSGCHGVRGNAQQPLFPRLAGLNAEYFEQRVQGFQAAPGPPSEELVYALLLPAKYRKIKDASSPEALTNMIGMAHAVDAKQLSEAAAWYAAQQPSPRRGPANPALVSEGKTLFNGDPGKDVPGCQDCHGPNGAGLGNMPRIAGQNTPYFVNQMERYRSGARGPAPAMGPVAQPLTDQQIRALAAYLQSL